MGPDAADFASADFTTAFTEGAQRAVRAFSADGAMEKTMSIPLGVMPFAMFIWVAAIEPFTHGWDLAKATGQSTDLDPALAEQLFGAGPAQPRRIGSPGTWGAGPDRSADVDAPSPTLPLPPDVGGSPSRWWKVDRGFPTALGSRTSGLRKRIPVRAWSHVQD